MKFIVLIILSMFAQKSYANQFFATAAIGAVDESENSLSGTSLSTELSLSRPISHLGPLTISPLTRILRQGLYTSNEEFGLMSHNILAMQFGVLFEGDFFPGGSETTFWEISGGAGRSQMRWQNISDQETYESLSQNDNPVSLYRATAGVTFDLDDNVFLRTSLGAEQTRIKIAQTSEPISSESFNQNTLTLTSLSRDNSSISGVTEVKYTLWQIGLGVGFNF